MKRIALGVLVVLLVLVGVLVARTLAFTPAAEPAPAPLPSYTVDANAVAAKLSTLVKLRTVSAPGMREDDQFDALYKALPELFPKFHEAAKQEHIGGGLLYTLEGSDASLPPLVLMAHHDVVPVEPGTESVWQHPPYSGEIAEGCVWGRGAMDDKGSLVGVMEALEEQLAAGWKPKRTVLLVSGHDEESGGSGAAAIAKELGTRGVKPWAVLDEGMVVTDGVVNGVKPKVAMIGIAEKGFLTLELAAKGEGGHASMPPKQTATGVVAAAIAKLEASPFPSRLDTPTGQMLDAIGPHMGFGAKLAMANRWLLAGAVIAAVGAKPSGAASLHTTTAATMFQGSVKDNVLPARASAMVNFRIIPGETRDTVQARVKQVIADDRVEISVPPNHLMSDPSPVSPTEGEAWSWLRGAVHRSYPEAVVAPALVVGATDARAFSGMTPNIYRFVPATVTPDDLPRIHGANERMGVETLAGMVKFYRLLLETL
ncbi:MAG: M20 family peptidase [Myxococcaceae bacterium]